MHESPKLIDLASLVRQYGKAKLLSDGRRVHAYISSHGYDRNTFLGNCLVEMYGNCGGVEDARAVFDNLTNPNLFSWNILIKAFGQNGSLEDARAVFERTPNPDLYSWTTLINAYGQNGRLKDAQTVFNKMPHRDVFSWTAMITAFVQNEGGKDAFELFYQMQIEGVLPNKVTFICILDACATLGAVKWGQNIHTAILDRGYEGDLVVGTALVNMYGKCGHLHNARSIFGRMPHRDVASWNAMIAVSAHHGHCKGALELFNQMQHEGLKPEKITFLCALDACANQALLREGLKVHVTIIDLGFEKDGQLGNALVNMYGKCGSPLDASSIFGSVSHRDVISWNIIISALAFNKQSKEALELLYQMQDDGIKPDKISFVCAFDACASLSSLKEGQKMHNTFVHDGYELDAVVETSLIGMYGKCGSLSHTRSVFGMSYNQDAVCWTAMIVAFTQNGHGKEALDLFYQVQLEGRKLDEITFVCALDACASLAAIGEGQKIYATSVSIGYDDNLMVKNALIDMYGKCGNLRDAKSVFDKMQLQDAVSWNSMIGAFAHSGHGEEALCLFHQMVLGGIKPDKITFICLLTACSHTGHVNEAGHFFVSMHTDYGVTHCEEHYVCMIDLLGRAGHLDKAEHLINSMPCSRFAAWLCLLGACRIHREKNRAIHAASHCFELDPNDAAPYVVLSNLCATVWDVE